MIDDCVFSTTAEIASLVEAVTRAMYRASLATKWGHCSTQCKAHKKKEKAHLARVDDNEPALLLTPSEENPRQELVLLNEDKVWSELHQGEYGTLLQPDNMQS